MLWNQSILARVAVRLLTKNIRCLSVQVTDVRVLLPEVMKTLQYENTHINMKALTIFKNVIRHLEKKEASPIALALAGRLLPLFNDVRLLLVTEPRRRALCNGTALRPRPVGSTHAGPSPLSAPLGSCRLSSGLCSAAGLLAVRWTTQHSQKFPVLRQKGRS